MDRFKKLVESCKADHVHRMRRMQEVGLPKQISKKATPRWVSYLKRFGWMFYVLGWRVKRTIEGWNNAMIRTKNSVHAPSIPPIDLSKVPTDAAPVWGTRRERHMERYARYKKEAEETSRQATLRKFFELRQHLDMWGIRLTGLVFENPIDLYSTLDLKDYMHTGNAIHMARGEDYDTTELVEFGHMNRFIIYTKPVTKEKDDETETSGELAGDALSGDGAEQAGLSGTGAVANQPEGGNNL